MYMPAQHPVYRCLPYLKEIHSCVSFNVDSFMILFNALILIEAFTNFLEYINKKTTCLYE